MKPTQKAPELESALTSILGFSRTGVTWFTRMQVPTLGRFDRYKELIRQYPQALFYYSESEGGSSCGMISDSDRKGVR